jgi:hypothetical protein
MLKLIIAGFTALSFGVSVLPVSASPIENSTPRQSYSRDLKMAAEGLGVMCINETNNYEYGKTCATQFAYSHYNLVQGFGKNPDDAFRPRYDLLAYARGTSRDKCFSEISPYVGEQEAQSKCDFLITMSVNFWVNQMQMRRDDVLAYKAAQEQYNQKRRRLTTIDSGTQAAAVGVGLYALLGCYLWCADAVPVDSNKDTRDIDSENDNSLMRYLTNDIPAPSNNPAPATRQEPGDIYSDCHNLMGC